MSLSPSIYIYIYIHMVYNSDIGMGTVYTSIRRFPKLEVPQEWMVFVRKIPSKMNDEIGYPYFRKPLCLYPGNL